MLRLITLSGIKCNNEVSLKNKSIYNFDKNIKELIDLKRFLENFSGN